MLVIQEKHTSVEILKEKMRGRALDASGAVMSKINYLDFVLMSAILQNYEIMKSL
jgi:hypothetical protein